MQQIKQIRSRQLYTCERRKETSNTLKMCFGLLHKKKEIFKPTWSISFHLISRNNSVVLCKAAKIAYISKNPFPFNPCIFALMMMMHWCPNSQTGPLNAFSNSYKKSSKHASTIFLPPTPLAAAIFRPTLERIIFLFYFACILAYIFNHPRHNSLHYCLFIRLRQKMLKIYSICFFCASLVDWCSQVSVSRGVYFRLNVVVTKL